MNHSMYLESFWYFFFNDTATTEIYTLSLHDALPISGRADHQPLPSDSLIRLAPLTLKRVVVQRNMRRGASCGRARISRSEEHTSELQSRQYLVCRLLLEKKKINHNHT